MYKATVNDESLNQRLAISAGLHILLFAFLYFGLPHLIPPLPAHHDPVPIEIVTIADITNTRIKEEQQPPTPPSPPPQPQQAKPTPPPQPQAKPTPPQQPQPMKPEDVEALKPKPVEKKPLEKPAPPQPDLLASVLKNVAKMKPAEQAKPTEDKTDAKAPPAQAASHAPSLSDRLSMTEEDALRRQIEGCWSPPIGAKDAQNLVVELTIDVSPERTVVGMPDIVDKGRYNSDPFFRAAADSARRAVMNPHCSPLQLPDGKYDTWKHIDFTFDPRDML